MSSTAPEAPADFLPFIEMIAANARRAPSAIAFREGGRTLDWRTLEAHVLQVARALRLRGVQPGDTVAVLGHPSLPYAECLFGIVTARACVVPLPVSASPAALAGMLTDSGARLLLLDPAADALAAEAFEGHAIDVVRFGADGDDGDDYRAWRAQGRGDAPQPRAEPTDAFNIIYSSGTTGTPKGIVHLHGMRSRQSRRNGFGFGPGSRALLSTPMYSNTTITPLIGSLAHGGECILMRKFDATRFLEIAERERITHTMLVPVQYKRILALPGFDAADLRSLAVSQSTGAPMDLALKRDILARWPGRFLEVYGMTEGGVSCFLDARAHPDKLATVGAPGHGTEVFLIDDQGRRIPAERGPAPPGVVGEVVGRSPFMMAGYHNRPDANAEIRWYDEAGTLHHRTGDLGRFDADGFLTLLDRSKDVIISGGNNIYAADLEAILGQHPAVQDSAVIGIPSADWGETPLALVVRRAGAVVAAEALRDWVNARVGRTQRLQAVEWRDELPRSHVGKLSKKELRAPYWRKEKTT
jgi:acyl-CoA synthetase (AMP-forming)/AMP-acid ligase II